MPDISLLIPSAARPALVRRMLRSALETAVHPRQIEVVLCVDRNDADLEQFDFPFLSVRKVSGPRRQLGRALQQCHAASTGDALLLASEDTVFQTFGWDSALTTELNRFENGIALAWCFDGQGGTPSHLCVSRTACDLLGGVCPVTLHRYFAAAHLANVFAQLADRGYDQRVYLPGMLIERVRDTEELASPQDLADAEFDERTYIAWDEERGLLARELARRIVATAAGSIRSQPVRRAA